MLEVALALWRGPPLADLAETPGRSARRPPVARLCTIRGVHDPTRYLP